MGLHKDVAQNNMHEPKGMALLTGGASDIGKVVVSKGDGTTETRKLDVTELTGFNNIQFAYGQQTITNNTLTLSKTAAVDPTLNTSSDYTQVTGIFDSIPGGYNYNVTQQTNQLTVGVTGIYRIELWANTKSDTAATLAGFRFAINGVIAVGREPKHLMKTAGDWNNAAAFGFVSLTAGDVITLNVATSTTCNLTIGGAVFQLTLMRAL